MHARMASCLGCWLPSVVGFHPVVVGVAEIFDDSAGGPGRLGFAQSCAPSRILEELLQDLSSYRDDHGLDSMIHRIYHL